MRLPPASASPVFLGLLAVVFVAGDGEAQLRPLSVELRGGIQVPVEALRDVGRTWAEGAGSSPSFGVDFTYSPNWYVGVYGGFGQHRFDCPRAGCGRETDLVATGFDLGVRLLLSTDAVAPWLRGGLVSYRVEGSAPAGGRIRDVTSSRAYGVEGGVGLAIRLSDRFSFSPGLRYVRMTPDFSGPGPLPMRYLIADLGLVMGF